MFTLKATLVAMTAALPWRTGWSTDRAVDVSLAAIAMSKPAIPTPRGEGAAAEPACFIDEDWAPPPGAALVRRFVSTAAAASGETAPEAGCVRGWWSLADKPSRT